jgi:predicted RNA-binding Zn-ribbon protein involved in translation (DUF1610 family)
MGDSIMAERYFLKHGEAVDGPLSLKKLQELLAAKNVKANDLVGVSDSGPWVRMATVHKAIRAGQPLSSQEATAVEEPPVTTKSPSLAQLTSCKDCGKQISTRATSCPHCDGLIVVLPELPKKLSNRSSAMLSNRSSAIRRRLVEQSKKSSGKKTTRRRPQEAASEVEPGSPDFDRLVAMSEQAESLGNGPVEECVSCGELVGKFTHECPHCGELHGELKRTKKGSARINASTGEWGRRGSQGSLLRQNSQQNKVIYTLLYLWDSIPTMAKALSVIAVATYVIVILPLLAFQRQSYLDAGGPYGHNTTDTIYYSKASNQGKESLASYHLARREFRKALVRVHVRMIELKDDGVLPKKAHDNYQSSLLTTANDYQLTLNMWGDGMGAGGLQRQANEMAFLAAKANAFADELQNEKVVELLDELIKNAVGDDG